MTPLYSKLVCHLPGNEASGDMADAHSGDLDFSQVGGPTTGTTGWFTGRLFTRASNQYAKRTKSAAWDCSALPLFVAARVRLDSTPAASTYVMSHHGAAGNRGWYLTRSTSNVIQFAAYADGTTATVVNASGFGAISTGVVYDVWGWMDPVRQLVCAAVNGVETRAAFAGAGAFFSTADVNVGTQNNTTGNCWDGLIGDVWVCIGRIPTPRERNRWRAARLRPYPQRFIHPRRPRGFAQ